MIKKFSSHDFNEILNKTNNKIEEINNSISDIKNNINKKLLIIEHESEFYNYCMNKLILKSQEANNDNNTFILLNDGFKGLYGTYSNLIHPYFKKTPINIFNIISVNNSKPYFRDEVNVTINNVTADYYKNILMADNHENKQIFFEEFESLTSIKKNENNTSELISNDTITLAIEVDKSKVIGTSKFNMIEIDPFLYTSFDIEKIDIYGEDLEKPLFTTSKIESVGKTRIILDKKYTFKKVVFTITPKYSTLKNNTKIIPFGLKHIYFYEADFRNDSYVIIKYESNDYIDNIKNDMQIITPFGTFNSTLKEEGISIWLENNDGVLENEQEPSLNIKKSIARNIKTIYFKVPIGLTNYEKNSLIAFKLNIENR